MDKFTLPQSQHPLSHNFKNGLQIVPGFGIPLGAGPSASEKAIFLYLSFEHPFRKIPEK